MKKIADLFLTFAKIGTFTFGGGYAMIAMMEQACVERKQWISHDELMNVAVLAESTPGPIAINCATYTGYRQASLSGAIAATLGLVLPPFIIIYLISLFLGNILETPVIAHAFKGISIAVALLILDAAISMIMKMRQKGVHTSSILFWGILMLLTDIFAWNISSITLMSVASTVSISLFFLKKSFRKGSADDPD